MGSTVLPNAKVSRAVGGILIWGLEKKRRGQHEKERRRQSREQRGERKGLVLILVFVCQLAPIKRLREEAEGSERVISAKWGKAEEVFFFVGVWF